MGMTITEKILARAAGRAKVIPGENIWLRVDVLMTHDVCGPPTFQIFQREFGEMAKPWDPNRVVIFPDHYIFTADPHANRNVRLLRDVAQRYHLPHFFDVGTERYKGVCHIALAEEGFTVPGTVVIGTDSHTCSAGAFGLFATGVGNTDAAFILGTGTIWEKVPQSMQFIFEGELPPYLMAKDLILKVLGDITTSGATYRAMEFCGSALASLNMDERMTLTNMAIEAGAMNGVIAVDAVTRQYLQARGITQYQEFYSDADAHYVATYRYNVAKLDPAVALPHRPDNYAPVHQVAGTPLTKCYLGSCTGGKLYDFIQAARLLKGRTVRVPTFAVPGSTAVALQMEHVTIDGESVANILRQAGCVLAPSSCAACLGGPADTIGRSVDQDVVISTTNRNFPGRMGSKRAAVYLASPLTVAASAVTGVITDPRDVWQDVTVMGDVPDRMIIHN